MSDTAIQVDAPPERVFDVLSDPASYGEWVVGSKHVREADADWPRPGSRFHHTVGIGPINIKDHSEVESCDRPNRLVLRVKFRPAGTALVDLRLEADSGGTRVRMGEKPLGGPAARLYGKIADVAMHGRNRESLRRLKRLAEQPA